jgi:hypothetical protein
MGIAKRADALCLGVVPWGRVNDGPLGVAPGVGVFKRGGAGREGLPGPEIFASLRSRESLKSLASLSVMNNPDYALGVRRRASKPHTPTRISAALAGSGMAVVCSALVRPVAGPVSRISPSLPVITALLILIVKVT